MNVVILGFALKERNAALEYVEMSQEEGYL